MRRLTFAALVAGALIAVPSAVAGGWATAGLAPPQDISAGETWKAEVTILQHGQTPLSGVEPKVLISNGDVRESFAAKPTDKAGVYVANVEFPSSGEWNYAVYDGFGTYGGAQTHRFSPIVVGGASGGDSGFGSVRFGTGLGVALLGGALVFLALTRLTRRPRTAAALH